MVEVAPERYFVLYTNEIKTDSLYVFGCIDCGGVV